MSGELRKLRRTHYTSELKPRQRVVLMGWVHLIRDIGNIKFFILRDREGRVQVTAKKGATPVRILKRIDEIGKEWVVSVKGKTIANKKAPRGIEVIPQEIIVLNKTDSLLPMDVTGKVKADFDTRLKARVIDLRRPEVAAIFRVRDALLTAGREYLESQGFLEIETPKIIATATEGGAALFPISYFEREAFLRQSPQIYKELMTACFEKVYEIGAVFRAEPSDTPRHLAEVTQMDIEMGFADETDTWEVMDGLVPFIYRHVKKNCKAELDILNRKNLRIPKAPFKRVSYTKIIDQLNKKGLKIEWGEDIPPQGERVITALYDRPVIIYDFPMELKPYYIHPHPENHELSYGFDLIMDNIEIASGGRRIHDPDLYVKMIKEKGLNPHDFEEVVKFFRWGMPPHAGWAIGVDRLTMIITGASNVKEAVLFARDINRLTP